jgi:hypothetical protein
MSTTEYCKDIIETLLVPRTVCIPAELYESVIGEYFIGYADNLTFGNGTSAWAMLYNPPDSGVNLHVNVWTVTDIPEVFGNRVTFRAQFWFNAIAPGAVTKSTLVTPSNTALWPQPQPKIKLLQASDVAGDPAGGVKGFVRRGDPNVTIRQEENGKLIFPPGGNFMVFLSQPETPNLRAGGRIAFGWWEEKLI